MSNDDQQEAHSGPEQADEARSECPIVICGGGIVGLVLALALNKHGIQSEIYEQADRFQDGFGAALSMYPNGLRVIRDISPHLLRSICQAGCPYEYRRWMRHDGTKVCESREDALERRDDDLHSIGIKRWKLQKILFDAVVAEGISVHFSKRAEGVELRDVDGLVQVNFADGTSRVCGALLGADGANSKIRDFVSCQFSRGSKLKYTGTTCLFGLAKWPRQGGGICFPSSTTSKCHAVFFPVSADEQCFQFHLPVSEEDTDTGTWGVLGQEEGREACRDFADQLRGDGWHEEFVKPLEHVCHVVRFGFSLLKPCLLNWVRGPVLLLGDAAHPPVPYIGQGGQMGIEDAGTLAELMSRFCIAEDGSLDLNDFPRAASMYETMRIQRTGNILNNSKVIGREQQRRANSKTYNVLRETELRLQVGIHGTLPIYLPGVKYDYKEEVAKMLLKIKIRRSPRLFQFRRAEFHDGEFFPPPSFERTPREEMMEQISEKTEDGSSEISQEGEKPAGKKRKFASTIFRAMGPVRKLSTRRRPSASRR